MSTKVRFQLSSPLSFFLYLYISISMEIFFSYNACARKLNFLMSTWWGTNEREVNGRTTSEYKIKYSAVLFNSWIISLNILQSNMNSSALIFLFISYVYFLDPFCFTLHPLPSSALFENTVLQVKWISWKNIRLPD